MKKIPILILAGGKATRLRPFTDRIPKILVKIDKYPFIYYLIKIFTKKIIKKIYLLTGYKSNLIKKELKKNFYKKTKIEIISDGKKLLGTGGAIKNAIKKINTKFFFITYGDTILDINYEKVFQKIEKNKKNCLITIYKNNNLYDKSNIYLKNNKIIEYSKASKLAKHIDYGLLIFKKKIFTKFYKEKFDLSEIIKYQLLKNDIIVFVTKKRFYEFGTLDSLRKFRKNFKNNERLNHIINCKK